MNKRTQEKLHIIAKLSPELAELLNKFQGNYQAEFGKRISKSEIVNNALEIYIKKCYELSK